MNSIILQTISRLVLYIMLVFSAFLMVVGHNAPGGGFIGGLLASGALILQLLAFDLDYVERVFPVNFLNLTACGLLLAAITGLVPVFLGLPFLTSAFATYEVPGIGPVELTSAFFFDLGVFIVVVGSMMTVIKGIASDNNWRLYVNEARSALKEDAELWKH